MHSIRRAALRAATCSTRVVAVPRQQVASFAIQVSKVNARPATTLPLSRYFSQSARAAQDQQTDAVVEEAIGSAENDNSTARSEDSRRPGRDPQEHAVFVSNMTFDATDLHLREAFSQYGEIVSINIGRDGRGLSRGFGFIAFTNAEAAEKAVRGADKSFWHGRRINVQHRKPPTAGAEGGQGGRGGRRQPQEAEPTTSLYIGNIPYETSDADLNAMFKSLDNVIDVRVAVDRNTGWPRGFAHADFADLESAKKAYETLLTTSLGGRQLRVDFSQPRAPTSGNRGRAQEDGY